MNTSYVIRVLGREIPVRSTASIDQVQRVESLVNSRVEEASASLALPDPQLAAILALLNLAEELLALRAAVERDSEQEARLHRVLNQLDKCDVAGP